MAQNDIAAESAVNKSPIALVEAPDWAARARLNALQPVSRLPAEVLSLIPLTCALETRPTWFTRRHAQRTVFRKPGSGWLDVTQVCRAWRDAALGYPGLWSCADIPLHLGQKWARTFLTRSGVTPVTITLHPSDFEPFGIPEWAQNLLRAHLHRTTKLSVSGEASSYRALENLGQEVPRLTSIVLTFVDSHALSPLSNV
ncbi:hypothetical protein PENSPDRAFT_692374 [Peniophora sp. CONT]|nr:hypothetical protein PENSPDRAFT_692374 [Peniophora sp. CONT]